MGSPPQVRGKLSSSSLNNNIIGITPAGAGKTCGKSGLKHTAWDHPRRCGENSRRDSVHALHKGSPPQVRGKLRSIPERGAYLRITPAGAGKTRRLFRTFPRERDHPRRCGENTVDQARANKNIGSPPQVRGKQGFSFLLFDVLRITPAGAGKTLYHSRSCNAR